MPAVRIATLSVCLVLMVINADDVRIANQRTRVDLVTGVLD